MGAFTYCLFASANMTSETDVKAALTSPTLLYKIATLRSTLGFRSWSEIIFAGLTIYMVANFFAGYLGISLLYVGLLSVVGHTFAWYQIHLLGSLTERLEKFDAENKRLEDSVNNFKEQNAKLKKVGDRLAEENELFEAELTQMHSTLAGLETVQKTLETYAAENQSDLGEVIQSLNDTLAEQKQCVQKQSELLDQTKEATRSQEKILLMQLQSQCQFLDQNMGMTEQEFGMFLSMIPAKFKKTPAGMAFERVDRDGDGIVSTEEFHLLVDELVRSVAQE